ncbi:MAG: pyridoxamine 5'-phosphate oxidase family protein [Duodenibacillus sp.]|nr:pyridoxamine 5'-phosphate oxidase family protein [Duodenibacillus sp.]
MSETTAGRPVRRTERAMTREQAYEIIRATPHATLGTADAAGQPYCVPVTPVLADEGTLYFHATGWPGGRKEANMAANPKVCLVFTGKGHVLPEWYSVDFASAYVEGTASKVTDEAERRRAVELLLARHAPAVSPERNAVQLKHRLHLLAVWKVAISHVTGKARGARSWTEGKSLAEVQQLEPQPWLVGAPL